MERRFGMLCQSRSAHVITKLAFYHCRAQQLRCSNSYEPRSYGESCHAQVCYFNGGRFLASWLAINRSFRNRMDHGSTEIHRLCNYLDADYLKGAFFVCYRWRSSEHDRRIDQNISLARLSPGAWDDLCFRCLMILLLQGSVSRVRRLPVVSCLFFVVLAFDIIADFLVLSVESDSEVLGGWHAKLVRFYMSPSSNWYQLSVNYHLPPHVQKFCARCCWVCLACTISRSGFVCVHESDELAGECWNDGRSDQSQPSWHVSISSSRFSFRRSAETAAQPGGFKIPDSEL